LPGLAPRPFKNEINVNDFDFGKTRNKLFHRSRPFRRLSKKQRARSTSREGIILEIFTPLEVES
jgi:hypothetical protein